MLMNIWVKDTSSGRVHQVGTDPHDSLVNRKLLHRDLQAELEKRGLFDELED